MNVLHFRHLLGKIELWKIMLSLRLPVQLGCDKVCESNELESLPTPIGNQSPVIDAGGYISPHSEIYTWDTFSSNWHWLHTDDLHDQFWSVVLSRRDILNLTKRQHAVDDLAKNHMLSVQEIAFCCGYEELRGIRSRQNCRIVEINTWHPFVLVPEFAYKSLWDRCLRTEKT